MRARGIKRRSRFAEKWMMSIRCSAAILAVLVLAVGIPNVEAQGRVDAGRAKRIRVNREVTWSILENLITLNELGVAESLLNEHLKVDPLDGRSWLLLGQVRLRRGNVQAAEAAVSRGRRIIGAAEPGMVRYAEAELQLARGNRIPALLEFRALEKEGGPLAEKAMRARSAIQSGTEREVASIGQVPGLVESKAIRPISEKSREGEAPRLPWSASAAMSLLNGYDANILQLADSLAPSAAGLGSFYTTVGAQGLVAGSALGGILSLTGSAGYTCNYSALASGLNNINATVGAQWTTAPRPKSVVGFSLATAATSTFMASGGYDLYALSASLQPTLAFRLAPAVNLDLSVSGGLNRFPGVELTSDRDDRSGTSAGVTAGVRGLAGDWQFGVTAGASRQFAAGENFRTIGFTAAMNLGRNLPLWSSVLSGAFGYANVRYPISDNSRLDRLYSATLGWDVPIKIGGSDLRLTPSLLWTTANSSVDSAAFSKSAINLQVIYAF